MSIFQFRPDNLDQLKFEYSDRWLHSLPEQMPGFSSNSHTPSTNNENQTQQTRALNGINREKAIKIGEMDQLVRL